MTIFYFDLDKFFSEFVWISQQLLNFVDFFFVFFQKKLFLISQKKIGFFGEFCWFLEARRAQKRPAGTKGPMGFVGPNATSRGPMGPQTNIKNNLRSPGFSAFWMYVLFFVQLKF